MKEEKKIWSEKVLEKRLKEGIKKLGGKALKFYSEIDTSYPDRLIQMPGGKTYWVEVKSTNKDQTPLQKLRAKELTELGFMVFVIDDLDKLNTFVRGVTPAEITDTFGDGVFRLVALDRIKFKPELRHSCPVGSYEPEIAVAECIGAEGCSLCASCKNYKDPLFQ